MITEKKEGEQGSGKRAKQGPGRCCDGLTRRKGGEVWERKNHYGANEGVSHNVYLPTDGPIH